MKLQILITTAILVLTASLSSAEVYKIVDKDGKVTYTDKPPASSPNAPLELPPINTQPGLLPSPPPDESPPAEEARYSRIAILQPPASYTVTPGQLDLIVQVEIKPELQTGHLVKFLLDGKPVGRPLPATQIRLDNLERGTHKIEAIILDANGRRVAGSTPVEFHVQRPSRLSR